MRKLWSVGSECVESADSADCCVARCGLQSPADDSWIIEGGRNDAIEVACGSVSLALIDFAEELTAGIMQ